MANDKDNPELWAEFDGLQETCPKCGSENISNEDGPDHWNRLPVTCLDCGYQWLESAKGEG
jgi:predicted nucleic-acid-binding Zn-ribbon protein